MQQVDSTLLPTTAWAQATIVDQIDDALRTHPGAWTWTPEQTAAVIAARNVVAALFGAEAVAA